MSTSKSHYEVGGLAGKTDGLFGPISIPGSGILHKSRSHQGNEGTVDGVLSDIIEEILWLEGGHHDNIETECSTPREVAIRRDADIEIQHIDNRLKYWQNYIKTREEIKTKIKHHTDKKDEDILINRHIETGRINLVKRIMKYADRMNPTQIEIHTDPLESKFVCGVTDVFETIPKLERTKKFTMEIVDMPQACQMEQGVDNFPPEKKSSWLNSNYLGQQVLKCRKDIQNLIEYYPDINELQVVGEKKTLVDRLLDQSCDKPRSYEPCTTSATDDSFCKDMTIRVVDADSIRQKTNDLNYQLTLNEVNLDYTKKGCVSVHFDLVFDTTSPCEKMKATLLTITNSGLRAIDFKFQELQKKNKKMSVVFNRLENFTPAFYFDKNPFRLAGGATKHIKILYSCARTSINSETWILETVPKFLKRNSEIYCHLFGSCEPLDKGGQKFQELKDTLINKGNEAMAQNLISSVLYPATMPSGTLPYIQSFTDEEMFNSLYPKINFSETFLDEMRQIYGEMLELLPHSKKCRKWSFDLNELRDMITQLPEDTDRKEYFRRYTDTMNKVRNVPLKKSSIFRENQKFVLVRSVIVAAMDRIDAMAFDLKISLMQTELNLDYNECVILNRHKKPSKMMLTSTYEEVITSSTESNWMDSPSFCVVKTEDVQNKKSFLLSDSLYFQIANQLGQMAEDIVSVIEGVKNLF